jgi:hypothetical protein
MKECGAECAKAHTTTKTRDPPQNKAKTQKLRKIRKFTFVSRAYAPAIKKTILKYTDKKFACIT